jgi:hypothetical protein
MKKFTLIVVLLFSFAAAQAITFAGNATPEEIAQSKTALITQKVSLTEDQSAKINHILLEYYQNVEKLKGMNLPAQQFKLRSDVLKSNRDKSIDDKLTYDQRLKKKDIALILK